MGGGNKRVAKKTVNVKNSRNQSCFYLLWQFSKHVIPLCQQVSPEYKNTRGMVRQKVLKKKPKRIM